MRGTILAKLGHVTITEVWAKLEDMMDGEPASAIQIHIDNEPWRDRGGRIRTFTSIDSARRAWRRWKEQQGLTATALRGRVTRP